MADELSLRPIQVLLDTKRFIDVPEPQQFDGGNKDFYSGDDRGFAEHKKRVRGKLQAIGSSLQGRNNGLGFVKVQMREDALAKSYRPLRDAITRTIVTLPQQLRRSPTWDQGAEMARHPRLKIDTGIQVYFCDPQSPWQRGANENTNGLLRQYFPKDPDLSAHGAEAIAAVAAALNARPRKALDWMTPAEALDPFLP